MIDFIKELIFSTRDKKIKELQDDNWRLRQKIERLEADLKKSELDLRIVKMYLDDDEAVLELLEEAKKSKPIPNNYYGQLEAQRGLLANAARYSQLAQERAMSNALYKAQTLSTNAQNGVNGLAVLSGMKV